MNYIVIVKLISVWNTSLNNLETCVHKDSSSRIDGISRSHPLTTICIVSGIADKAEGQDRNPNCPTHLQKNKIFSESLLQ